jgi:hypothetical protein
MSTAAQALRRVAELAAELGSKSALADPEAVFRTLISAAGRGVAGAESVSVVARDGAGLTSVVATDDRARRVDQRQFELGAGPCLQAIAEARACHVPDLGRDRCWPGFGQWASRECGLASALSVGFGEPGADGVDQGGACLNLYSARVGSFDEESVQVALLLAGCAGTALAAANNALRVANLERALHTNADIGTAIGVIMARYRRSHDQAMELLRSTSQRTHRKVSDLAAQVVNTGSLPGLGSPRRRAKSYRNVR